MSTRKSESKAFVNRFRPDKTTKTSRLWRVTLVLVEDIARVSFEQLVHIEINFLRRNRRNVNSLSITIMGYRQLELPQWYQPRKSTLARPSMAEQDEEEVENEMEDVEPTRGASKRRRNAFSMSQFHTH